MNDTIRDAKTSARLLGPTREPHRKSACRAILLVAAFGLVAVAAGGCSLLRRGEEEAEPALAARSSDDARIPDENGDPGERDEFELSSMELEIWRSPSFRKRFTESYAPAGDIQPTVTVDERKILMDARALMVNDKMDQARRMLEQRLTETSGAVLYAFLANIYFQQEKFDEAARHYEKAIDRYGNYRSAIRNLALIYVRQGDYGKALPRLTKVIELGGGDSIVYGLLGFSYFTVEKYVAAESAYRMASLLEPDRLDWKIGLAQTFFKQQRYGEAAALCGHLISEHPEKARLWLLQANAYIGLDQPMKAAGNFEFVDSLGKATADTLNMTGDIYVNEKLFDLAAEAYVRALEKAPEKGIDQAIRAARVLALRGAHSQTQRLIERIQELGGEDIVTDKRKNLLKLEARVAVARGHADEEVTILEEIVDLDPLDGEALILLGQHHTRNGEPEKAIFYYERAAGIEDYEADAKVRHAQVLAGERRFAEAIPLLKSAQQIKHRENVQEFLEDVERAAKQKG